ncbi:MAG: hypothetical protein JXB45_10160 [Candidatus Krumholzibacteriota bacterium]|nr:hypothetical protein [Candidatus Krumholzibacteriota bacterium]
MKRKKLVVTLLVLAGIIVAASVALRLVLTRDKLLALIVPRIEKAVQAEITIGDIGIRFPFGFGVSAREVAFTKALPPGKTLRFDTERLEVKVSLISLIRRQPEIHKVEIKGGAIKFSGGKAETRAELEGIQAEMSMKPEGGAYGMEAEINIHSTALINDSLQTRLSFNDLWIKGRLGSDLDFNALEVKECRLGMEELLSVGLTGRCDDLRGRRKFSLRIQSDGGEILPLVTRILALDLEKMVPALQGKKLEAEMPLDIRGGTWAFSVDASGELIDPASIVIRGELELENVAVDPRELKLPLKMNGKIAFSRENIRSDRFAVVTGGSAAALDFDVTLDKGSKPEKLSFACNLDIDAADLSPGLNLPGKSVKGKLKADLRGGGKRPTLADLFPAGGKKIPPPAIAQAWKEVQLEGKINLRGGAVISAEDPLPLSELNIDAVIKKGGISDLEGGFLLGKSPFRVKGSMQGIFPAFAELAQTVKENPSSGDLGKLLDSIQNAPEISVEVNGHSFDARPLEKAAGEKNKPAGSVSGKEQSKTGKEPQDNILVANPGTLLMLKKTAFQARIDTIITTKMVLYSCEAGGTIRDGRLNAYPVKLDYAGGKGEGKIDVDLRDPRRVKTRVNLAFRDIDAGQALGRIHSMGSLVTGRFSFKVNGDLLSGPGINPLTNLEAAGNASSSGGEVNLAPLMGSVSQLAGSRISFLEQINYRQWQGNYLIRDGRFSTNDWKIKSPSGDWDIKGFFGFDGTLQYAARLFVTPQAQQNMKDLSRYRDLVELFRDDQGNLILDFDIGGTAKSPRVQLDQSRARKKAGEKLMDELKKGAGDKLKDLLKKKD